MTLDKRLLELEILFVEDDVVLNAMVSDALGMLGFKLTTAKNGEEGLKLFESKVFDVVLSDINMPIMDGLTAAETIVVTTPVLMLTAFSQRELVERANAAGVMAYVLKPFTINDLIPAIEIAASRYLQMSALADEVSNLNERLETRKLIDRAKGILMKALNLSEPEAFSWIQRAAMDRRLTMKQVAEAVISPQAVPES